MAIRFHELPTELFEPELRPAIARFNDELRDLFALESTLSSPADSRRSDLSIARRESPSVDVSRVTPTISSSGGTGSATVTVGTPALSFGTANAVGSTSTVVSINSSIALFGTGPTSGVSVASANGTSAYAARADHVHGISMDNLLPTTTLGDLIVHNGSTNTRLGVSGNTFYTLIAMPSDPLGVSWAAQRNRLIAAYTSSTFINDTNAPASFSGDGFSVPANGFAPGRHMVVKYRGVIGSTTPAATLKLDLISGTGPLTVCTTGARTFPPSMDNRKWDIDAEITCKTDGVGGTLEAQAWFSYASSATARVSWEMGNTASIPYDTTIAQTWRAQVTWGTSDSSNIITLRQRTAEFMEAP